MSSLSVNFNQLVDLAVNPSLGTVNTSMLHNLLHIVIAQLQSSSKIIEFQGVGSAAIEKLIVNSPQNCKLQIKEFEVRTEVDDATGNIVKRREQIQKIESNENTKLFTVRIDSKVEEYPMGFPFNLIQFHPNDKIQKFGEERVHDVMTIMDPTRGVDEKSLRTKFDIINISKRIEALEIGMLQLAEVLKVTQCDLERSDRFINIASSDLSSLNLKIDKLVNEMENFSCRCNRNKGDFQEISFNDVQNKFTREFTDLSAFVQSEMKNFKTLCDTSHEGIEKELVRFKDSVSERLESYRNDFVGCMIEIQTMLDAKLDKFYVPDLKKYFQDMIRNFEEKIENADCPKPLAAGAVKKIFKDLNCVSCGVNVIQAETSNTTQSMLMINEEHPYVRQRQLLKTSSRACNNQVKPLNAQSLYLQN